MAKKDKNFRDRPDTMSLNNLQSIGDDEAITEIDFDSFLNGNDDDFFSDVEKAGENAHKMDEQLQSVLNNPVDSADSDNSVKAVSKGSGVRTGFFRHDDENATGLSELWENPDDYFETEELPDASFEPTEDSDEQTADVAAPQESAATDGEAEQTEFEFDEDFEKESGLFDIKRDMANLLSQLHDSVADDDAAFNAILYEIETNDAIVPTDINVSAAEIAAQSNYTEVAAPEAELEAEDEEEPEYSQYLLVEEETAVEEEVTEAEQVADEAEETAVSEAEESDAPETETLPVEEIEETTETQEQLPFEEAEDSALTDIEETAVAESEQPVDAAAAYAAALAASAVATPVSYEPEQVNDEPFEQVAVEAEFEDEIFVNPFEEETDAAPQSGEGKFTVTIPDDDASGVVNEGTQPLIYYKSAEADAQPASPLAPVDFEPAAEDKGGKKSDKKSKKKAEKENNKADGDTDETQKGKHSDTPRKIVFVTAILTIVVCVGYLVNAWVIEPMRFKSQSSEMSDAIVTDVVDEENPEEVWDRIKKEHPDVDFPENMLPAYANIYAINSDLAGWITIDGLDINLPIAQGNDNRYYLYRDIKKNSTKYGVPYFDSRNNIDPLDKNTIVYGHNMRRDDLIFGMLEEYRTIEGWRKAPVIQCNTIYGNYNWKVYAVFLADGKTDSEGYFFNYVFTNISDESFTGYIREIDKRKFYTTGVDIEPTDKILTLSTCCYDFDDARLVVVARLVREGESVAVNTSGAYVNENPKYPLLWYKANGKENIAYKDDEKWRA